MPRFYLNTFGPLVCSAKGLDASARYGLPPFIDGSIRREPDFEHASPAITCLCRTDKFTPRLEVGDAVAYMTVMGRYGGAARHRRLVAVLEITDRFESHDGAADWYRGNGLHLPSNLMVAGNLAKPLAHSHQRFGGHKSACASDTHEKWDREYADRAARFGRVVACRPLYVAFGWDACVVHDDDLQSVFGRVPGTQNPGALPFETLQLLTQRLGIAAPLCSP